jgi:hypothetical protein
MRSVLLATVALFALHAPASAADGPATGEQLEGLARTLENPETQAAVAAAAGAMMGAMLDIPLDNFARAIEPLEPKAAKRIQGRTLRDLAAGGDAALEARAADGTRKALGSAGAMASAIAVMLPELERAARRMKEALPDLR